MYKVDLTLAQLPLDAHFSFPELSATPCMTMAEMAHLETKFRSHGRSTLTNMFRIAIIMVFSCSPTTKNLQG